MSQSFSLRRVDADDLPRFLAELWAQLRRTQGLEVDEAPEGIGELTGRYGPVAYAIGREHAFAALRWHEPDTVHEAFFLRCADGTARQGWSQLSCPDVAPVRAEPRVVEPSLPGAQPAELHSARPPCFTELVAVLASHGSAVLDAPDERAEREALRAQLQYYQALAGEHAEAARQARARLRELSQALAARENGAESADPPVIEEPPQDLDGLAQWAHTHAARITVLARALNAAKRSRYLQPAHVYQALEFLAGPYREHRCGQLALREFEAALAASGLRLAGAVGESVAGMHGSAYFVHHNGRRRQLELHLLRGGGRDERYCLRVYFFWDEATRKAVVGWLPSHLDNSLS